MTLSRPVRAGALRDEVTIQKRALVENAQNERIDTFSDVVTVWANVQGGVGREFWQAKQLNSEISGIMRMRFLTGIKPTMRVVFGNRIFEIVAVTDPNGRRRELVIWYKEALD